MRGCYSTYFAVSWRGWKQRFEGRALTEPGLEAPVKERYATEFGCFLFVGSTKRPGGGSEDRRTAFGKRRQSLASRYKQIPALTRPRFTPVRTIQSGQTIPRTGDTS